MDKILFLDVETTGLRPDHHDVIELAYIVEIGGEIKTQKCLTMQPFNYENIDPAGLAVSGHTVEELKTFMDPKDAYKVFLDDLARHCDKYNRNDKFYPAGFNCGFDLEFIDQFFKKNNDKYWGSWQNWRALDPRPLLLMLDYMGIMELPKYNLEEACKKFDIELDAHSSLSDIVATRELLRKLATAFKYLPNDGKEQP